MSLSSGSICPAATLAWIYSSSLAEFVITRALRRELDANGHLALRNFYVRRFFRIVPPLAFMAAIILLIGGWRNALDAAAALLSVMNWYRTMAPESGGLFRHAWSLSIEEQFYLIWPLALIVLNRRGWTTNALIAAVISIMIWRAALSFNSDPARIYMGLDSHTDGLLIGCLIAPAPSSRMLNGGPFLLRSLSQLVSQQRGITLGWSWRVIRWSLFVRVPW